MSEWGRVIHFQTFKVGLRHRFKDWLRWRFEWLLRVLSHGRIRCIVLGHEHPPPAPVRVILLETLENARSVTAEELAAGTDISEFVETPPPFYLDEGSLDDTFDDIHGEWPGDLKYWRWDEGQGDDDVAT